MRLIAPAILPMLLALGVPAGAQTRPAAKPPAPTPAATPSAPAASNVPQQTTASFADWTLRCSRVGPAPGTPFCEVAQGVQRDDKPVAQVALGRPGRGQALQLTLLVPVNVGLATPIALLPPKEGDAPVELTWRRCLPAGCIADARLPEDAVVRLRNWADAGRFTFTDGLGRPAALPFSPRGLAPALDALAKEEAAQPSP